MSELVLPLVTEENACLPLSINVVAQYWGVNIPLPQERAKLYPAGAGSVLIEGVELAEAHGLAVSVAGTDLDGLFAAIDSGIPPVVILPGIGGLTHHISVISGYDDKTVYHYIPKTTSEGLYEGAIPHRTFDEKWAQEGRVAIILGTPEAVTSAGSESLRLCMEAERATILGDSDKAKSFLERAVSLEESNTMAWLLLAGMQNGSGSDACVDSYSRCIRANPSCYLAYVGLGNHYLKRDEIARAEENYTRAIRIDPDRSGSVYKNRAYLREKRGAFSDAADDLAIYVRLSPAAPDAGAMQRAVAQLRSM